MNKKIHKRKRCRNCGKILNAIWFAADMIEEWSWNGYGYNECTAHNSLVDDPQMEVICPNCSGVVGIGRDFGF